MGLIDGILTPILSPLLPTGASTETPSSTSTSQVDTTSSVESTSSSPSPSPTSSETTSATDSVSSSSASSESLSLSSTESLSSSSSLPSTTPSSSPPVISTTTSGTSVVTVTVSSTSAAQPSTSEGAVNSADAPSSKSFLQNKPLAGAVFGIAGLIALILLISIATVALRRSRRKRDIAHAVSFDPSMLDRVTDHEREDRSSVLEKGRNSGGGGSWESHGYSTSAHGATGLAGRYDHIFPGGNNAYYSNAAANGYPQPYGGAGAVYNHHNQSAAGYHGAYGNEAGSRQPYADATTGGHYTSSAPLPPPPHDGWLTNPHDEYDQQQQGYGNAARTSYIAGTPVPPSPEPEDYKAAYTRDLTDTSPTARPAMFSKESAGTPKDEEPGMQLKVTNQ